MRIRMTITALLVAATLVACAAPRPTATPAPTRPAVSPGEILIPACPADADCGEGFVVGETFYGLICQGVDPAAVANQALATGDGIFAEVRAIGDLPPETWLAVRGDLPCLPAEGGSLEHEWYLAQSEVDAEDLDDWANELREVILR